MSDEWRPLDEAERAILERVLEEEFAGRDELAAQIEDCEVKAWHDFAHCRSLEFRVHSDVLLPEEMDYKLPIEASFTDTDGRPVDILLFQKERRIWAMEFVVYGDRQTRMPGPSELDVWVNSLLY